MNEFIQIWGIAICVGGLDYLIKGVPEWKKLKPFFQGSSWHIVIGVVYLLSILALSFSTMNYLILVGIFAIINEDFAYWCFHRIHRGFWKVKPPFNLELWFYYFYLVVINGTLLILFEVFNGR